MIQAILVALVIALILDRIFILSAREKVTRKAIVKFGEKLNMDIRFWDFIGEVSVYVKDLQLKFRKERHRAEELKDIYTDIDRGDKELKESIKTLSNRAEEADTFIHDSLMTLMKHLGLEFEAYHQDEADIIKVAKVKKSKK